MRWRCSRGVPLQCHKIESSSQQGGRCSQRSGGSVMLKAHLVHVPVEGVGICIQAQPLGVVLPQYSLRQTVSCGTAPCKAIAKALPWETFSDADLSPSPCGMASVCATVVDVWAPLLLELHNRVGARVLGYLTTQLGLLATPDCTCRILSRPPHPMAPSG
jgi:hypothetical protein